MEYRVRSPRDTTRNALRAGIAAKYGLRWSYQVIEILDRIGVEYPAHHKRTTEEEYYNGLLDLLIDNRGLLT
jgi:hypothetical protein